MHNHGSVKPTVLPYPHSWYIRLRTLLNHQSVRTFLNRPLVLTSAFLFPSTESGVFLPPPPPTPPPLLYSSQQVAWYIFSLTLIASIQTKSLASTSHCGSNFSWQIGQGAWTSAASVGTWIYWSFVSFFAAPVILEASVAPFDICAGAASSCSRNSIHSLDPVSDYFRTSRFTIQTYPFVNIPTPMNTALCGVRIFYLEMPIHMPCLHFLAFGWSLESATARCTLIRQCFI